MLIVSLCHKLSSLSLAAYKEIIAPQSESAQCHAYFLKILSFMLRKGGHLASVGFKESFDKNSAGGKVDVSLYDATETHSDAFIRPTHSSMVSTSSWKELARDLIILRDKFEKTAKKKNGISDAQDIVNFMDEFNQYLRVVESNAKKIDSPHRAP